MSAGGEPHQRSGGAAGSGAVLTDIADAAAFGQIGVECNNGEGFLFSQLVQTVFHQIAVERHDGEAIDPVVIDKIVYHADLLDRIERAGQAEDGICAEYG